MGLLCYWHPDHGVDTRLDDLRDKMTLDEKIARLGFCWSAAFVRDGAFDDDQVASQTPHCSGLVAGIGAAAVGTGGERGRCNRPVMEVPSCTDR
jgi:hypothetical protein